EPIDIGQVGDISGVNPAPVCDLIKSNRIPVLSSVAIDQDSPTEVLNVNADAAAAALAVAVEAEKLIMLTDVEGVYKDFEDKSSLISHMGMEELKQLMPTLGTGMIPKMDAALQALEGGVNQVHVIDGRQPHSMLLEVFTDQGVGTMITRDDNE
ncbi:MAG TPA: acetylglutamate kinase, partial [Actinomyces sp.]|nr:acetylglutamate kinase [Actinomyces sp.]